MNLYRVKCVGPFDHSLWVYVIASTETEASSKALDKMRDLEWRYRSYVENVTLMACESQHDSPALLIMTDAQTAIEAARVDGYNRGQVEERERIARFVSAYDDPLFSLDSLADAIRSMEEE